MANVKIIKDDLVHIYNDLPRISDEQRKEALKKFSTYYYGEFKHEPVEEEWIWVDGYKGTDADMKCRDYQFSVGSKYDMPEDAEINVCHSGFHLCKDLKDVFHYYKIGDEHRFFKVSALVRKSEYEKYGRGNGYSIIRNDKLASKSILFTRELTPDEIFEVTEYSNWTEEQKREAMKTDIGTVRANIKVKTLVDLGYSEPFAKYVINRNYYDEAVAVSSQTDLSMDMKIVAILEM